MAECLFSFYFINSSTNLLCLQQYGYWHCLSFVFLGEKISKVKVIAFVLAMVGLYVSFSFSITAFSLLAASMAVLNGIASGGEVSFSKKLTGSYSPLYITWLSWVIVFVTNAPVSFLLGEVQHIPSINIVWLYQLAYVFAGLFVFGFVIAGLKYVEASIGGLIGLLEIVFSVAFGLILFGENPSQRAMIGAVLVIFAASLPHVVDLYKTKMAKAFPPN